MTQHQHKTVRPLLIARPQRNAYRDEQSLIKHPLLCELPVDSEGMVITKTGKPKRKR